MATKYSKDKCACIKNLKNEPLANLTSDSKKRKLSDEKADTTALPLVHVTLSSPTLCLEVTVVTPPITLVKGKGKIGMSVWDDPATTLGRAHNVITNNELKSLSSIPSHELVNRHIHKLVQVCSSVLPASPLDLSVCVGVHSFLPYLFQLGHWVVIAYNNYYLVAEEKVVLGTSKAESVEVECSKLKKDLIAVMNERNDANQKIKELTEALRVEKALVI